MLKELIETYTQQNKAIATFLKESGDNFRTVDECLPLYINKLKESGYNPELGSRFTSQLLLTEKEELYNQYELNDIEQLLESLLALQKTNIEAYLNAGHFEFGIMENRTRAKEIVLAGLEMAKEKVAELELLLADIEEETLSE